MCLARVYMSNQEEARKGNLVLADVAQIKVQDGTLLLRALLGEEKVVEGTISAVDFVDSVVTVAGADE